MTNAGTQVIVDTWTIADPAVVSFITTASASGSSSSLSAIQNPALVALAPGSTTISATYQGLSTSINVTVYAGSFLPLGTVEWSLPTQFQGRNCGEGVLDALIAEGGAPQPIYYAAFCDALVALDEDGSQLWIAHLDAEGGSYSGTIPDYLGGAVVHFSKPEGGDFLLDLSR